MSRKGIERCDISMHPYGLPHGPQPGMTEASIGPHTPLSWRTRTIWIAGWRVRASNSSYNCP
jgi:homogentisate 1,2-dioxygenase